MFKWPSWQWVDKAKEADKRGEGFAASRAAERTYTKQLRSVAQRVQVIIATCTPKEAANVLDDYAKTLAPWAAQAATKMIAQADKKNRLAFEREAARQGLDLRVVTKGGMAVGEAYQKAVAHNVSLIQSIVTHSRDKVAKLVTESVISGTRAEELAKQIEHVGEVSAARARVIAATEVSKAGTALTRARAESVGSEGYIWRTARDGDTRDSHRAMEGRFVKWSEAPTLDNMTGHAGEYPNCRCHAEPVIKRRDGTTIGSTLPTREEETAQGQKTLFSQWEKQEGSPTIALLPKEALPNADQPQGIDRKLTGYSLNAEHERGGHKARVFQAALGMGPEHADMLQKQIKALLPHMTPKLKDTNKYGQTYNVIMPITGPNGRTVDVLTGWIYDRSKDGKSLSLKPRMTTCMIKDK